MAVKKRFAAVAAPLCFGLLSVASCGVAWAQVSGKPALKIEQPVFAFGTVVQGAKVDHDFTIKNTGTADLQIQRVVTACGCTAATVSPGPIAPGQEGKIHVTFDSSGFSGEKLKTIRVYTNDPDDPTPVLSLRGFVETDVQVEPRRISFEEVVRGSQASAQPLEFSIKVREGSGIKIQGVRALSKNIILKEKEVTPKLQRYLVSLDPSAPVGELRERIVVNVSGGTNPSINVPVYALVRGKLQLKPATVSFGIIEGTQILERSVKLESGDLSSFKVKEVRPSDGAIQAVASQDKSGKGYTILVKLDPSKVKRDLRATVDITTDSNVAGSADENTLSLNVYGILPPKTVSAVAK